MFLLNKALIRRRKSGISISISLLSYVLDILGILLTPFVALISLIQAKGGSVRLPISYKIWDFFGVQPVRHHYYQPVFNVHTLPDEIWSQAVPLEGINFQSETQIKLLQSLQYQSELLEFSINYQESKPLAFYYDNPNFSAGDAEILYSMLRSIKPATMIEIGSGFSTRIAKAALDRNMTDSGISSRHICIEPYEMKWLDQLNLDQVIRTKVENVDLDVFRQLEAGDVLFIDSSHVIRMGGDVIAEYLKILPSLKKGVIVHIHDIFIPYDYPRYWVQKERRFWDEQYLLQAFLAFNNSYSILLACHYLSRDFSDEFGSVCPVYHKHLNRLPVSSFWLRRDA